MIEASVASLAQLCGGRVVGDGSRSIDSVGDLRSAGPRTLCFVRDAMYRELAQTTRAGAVLVYEELDTPAVQIVVGDVAIAFARLAQHFHPLARVEQHRVHERAVIDPAARLEPPLDIGPGVVIGKASIGAGSMLMAGTVVGDGCSLGADCMLHANVTLYRGVRLGNRVQVHSGTVIGADGFGYAKQGDRYLKLPQIGGVVIDDDVEIGANCTVDRGAIGDTRIGARTKIDNLCHIAHNCVVGTDNAFAAACMLGGSTVLGDRVTFAGHVITGGHLRIVDDVRIGGNSGITGDVDEPGDYMGWPLMDKRQYLRVLLSLRELTQLQTDVADLKKRLP
ncbi:MAG TPA: UDP-3-O-(3-hydroxymyristoyl)glucosamine N-acyltransferase, partial [Planctomycetota bacterium]|nr:UDP-3-O-(3-hydroxymyristoyl)glucosamine N-acyltransferase [Planctomycetota bacterium]